jgi:alpha-aminoadipic semialdehyde synthase
MFSHTAKGQDYNRPLLARFTNSTARLIDYELLTNEDGKRVVAFGWYAGAAGAIEGLISLAHDHLSLGVSSPFLVSETSIQPANVPNERRVEASTKTLPAP